MQPDPETLERLLIDRVLGQTSDDVNTLLDAAIDASPEARELAELITITVELAEATIGARAAEAPPLDTERLRTALARRRSFHATINALSLAAAVLIGLTIGAVYFAADAASPPHPAPIVNSDMQTPRDSFWSIDRHAANRRTAVAKTDRTPWTWSRLTQQSQHIETLP